MYIRKWAAGAVLVCSLTLTFFSIDVLANEPEALQETRITAETGIKGFINSSNVRLRSEGNLDANVLANLNYGARLTIQSKEGEWYKVIHNNSSGYVFNEFVTFGESSQINMNGNVEMLDWWTEGQSIMRTGTIATVTDVSTGIQFQVRVLFGTNHADVEPLTAGDTEKKRQSRGGQWSWDRRAVWVTLENGRTFAASANGMPHDRTSISNNNFPGHFCIHFLNSSLHGSNRVDAEHQNQMRRAFNAS